jgi:hypothetical protein
LLATTKQSGLSKREVDQMEMSSKAAPTIDHLLSGLLKGSDKLSLSCGLKSFPKEIFSLADTLEFLDLSGNELSELPDDFARLKKLKILFLSQNKFTKFPKVLKDCVNLSIIGFKSNQIEEIEEGSLPINLRWLIITNNKLEKLPLSIGDCPRLQKLMLAGNQLKSLPQELSYCKNLQLLRISANQIKTIPEWLFTMPNLSWLAYAGNPSTPIRATLSEIPLIPWQNLEIKEMLGTGASGFIHEANLSDNRNQPVAVKIYKDAITSDGRPTDEINAAISAGHHPNLIQVLGKISKHPEQKQGLVLNLIPKTYTNLGLPPSYETCTRDTFPADLNFSLDTVISILLGMASVAMHLHKLGIMHGDLYAHNILIDTNTSHVLFGDFGAATMYDPNSEQAQSLERIEVRAFGCLIEDLLSQSNVDERITHHFERLKYLIQDCLAENVLLRPSFKEIKQRLDSFLII